MRREPETQRWEPASPYRWLRIRIQARHEANEMLDGELMRDSSSILATVRPYSSPEAKRLGRVRRMEVVRNA